MTDTPTARTVAAFQKEISSIAAASAATGLPTYLKDVALFENWERIRTLKSWNRETRAFAQTRLAATNWKRLVGNSSGVRFAVATGSALRAYEGIVSKPAGEEPGKHMSAASVSLLGTASVAHTVSEGSWNSSFEGVDELIEGNVHQLVLGRCESLGVGIKQAISGAHRSLKSRNPDRTRHVAVSLREALSATIREIAPDRDVRDWTKDPSMLHNGRPTRRARLTFAFKDLGDEYHDVVKSEISVVLSLMDLLQKCTHGIDVRQNERQLLAAISKVEGTIHLLWTLAGKT